MFINKNSVALSTAEAEYMVVGSCCAQLLWMKHQLEDFSLQYNNILIFCDDTSAICLTKNHVQYSRTKYIEIRHHLIRDHVLKGDVEVQYVKTNLQFIDIFTKALLEDRFKLFRKELGMTNGKF